MIQSKAKSDSAVGKPLWRRITAFIIVLYTAVCLFAFFFSNNAMFHPFESSYSDSPEIIKINVGDNEKISATYLKNLNSEFTILYSHGNAEDLGDVTSFLLQYLKHGFSVIAYDYRGYGTSDGTASEKNTYQDIEAVYDYLVNKIKIPSNKIIVMGRSVGGGPSTFIAEKKPVAGLVLESTFVSAFRVVTRIPVLPFDKFNNLSRIENINCPLMVVHGECDTIIPLWHGKKLYAAAKEPKLSLWVERAGHNNLHFFAKKYWTKLNEFKDLLKKHQINKRNQK